MYGRIAVTIEIGKFSMMFTTLLCEFEQIRDAKRFDPTTPAS